MAAWVCKSGKGCPNYPRSQFPAAVPCPICGEKLIYYSTPMFTPSVDWEARVAAALGGEAPASPPVTTDGAKLIYRAESDTLWVADAELRRLGYQPQDFDVVQLNDQFYELQGYLPKLQVWWVERINPDAELADLIETPVYEGPSSDQIVYVEIDGIVGYINPHQTEEEPI